MKSDQTELDACPYPERIWMQFESDEDTWCADMINEDDTEYIRADLWNRRSAEPEAKSGTLMVKLEKWLGLWKRYTTLRSGVEKVRDEINIYPEPEQIWPTWMETKLKRIKQALTALLDGDGTEAG